MKVQSIAPGSNDRLRLLITKSADTLSTMADRIKCPEKRAQFKARAAETRRRAQEL